MKKFFILNKKEGETPLEALDTFRLKHKTYKETKMTYAGRLDPMASGLLLVLAGDEVRNKEKYLKLDKEYKFEILFGFSTDTYDMLGKVTSAASRNIKKGDLEKTIKENLRYFTGTFIQTYPMYSSKTVAGKPLFSYGRSGISVDLPEREVSVKKLKLQNIKKIHAEKLLQNIEKRIAKVHGDFRQKEILKTWHQKLIKNQNSFFVASFVIQCSSGTYVRGIADSLGKKISIPTLAYSIKRTKIGRYNYTLEKTT